MSVYNRQYRLFKGPFTPILSRFLIIPRFAFKRVFKSKLFTSFFVLCFLPLLISGAMIYIYNNAAIIDMLGIKISDMLTIDTTFFSSLLNIQMGMCFLLTLFLGPPLISPDLANNALPLYLSRPFDKRNYIAGKFSVIYILNSCVSWIPASLLFLLQAYLHNGPWLFDHLHIAMGLILGSNLFIITMTLFALAISAWLKWRSIAGFAFIALPFITMATGDVINTTLHVKWGRYLDINKVMDTIYNSLFHIQTGDSLSVSGCYLILLMAWSLSLLILQMRIKAYEVIR
ncbi:MAG: hypothetical protein CSA81_05525 [Acidobacteria bacterium]|nr:MAG: hypothetical protein CSA81_05525 [Acidobacteriota bacterium]PIE90951.1 MAG: hypothetical protein CR997_03585 [Acidobacteriota bacterium]